MRGQNSTFTVAGVLPAPPLATVGGGDRHDDGSGMGTAVVGCSKQVTDQATRVTFAIPGVVHELKTRATIEVALFAILFPG